MDFVCLWEISSPRETYFSTSVQLLLLGCCFTFSFNACQCHSTSDPIERAREKLAEQVPHWIYGVKLWMKKIIEEVHRWHRHRTRKKLFFFSDTLLIRLEWHSLPLQLQCVCYAHHKWKLDFDAFFLHARCLLHRTRIYRCIVCTNCKLCGMWTAKDVAMWREKGESSKIVFTRSSSIKTINNSVVRVHGWRQRTTAPHELQQGRVEWGSNKWTEVTKKNEINFLPHSSPVSIFFSCLSLSVAHFCKIKKEIFRFIFARLHGRRCPSSCTSSSTNECRFHRISRAGSTAARKNCTAVKKANGPIQSMKKT